MCLPPRGKVHVRRNGTSAQRRCPSQPPATNFHLQKLTPLETGIGVDFSTTTRPRRPGTVGSTGSVTRKLLDPRQHARDCVAVHAPPPRDVEMLRWFSSRAMALQARCAGLQGSAPAPRTRAAPATSTLSHALRWKLRSWTRSISSNFSRTRRGRRGARQRQNRRTHRRRLSDAKRKTSARFETYRL